MAHRRFRDELGNRSGLVEADNAQRRECGRVEGLALSKVSRANADMMEHVYS